MVPPVPPLQKIWGARAPVAPLLLAPMLFQKRAPLSKILDPPLISDDVIVFGKSQADHDIALKAVFQKFTEVNLTLNKSKCEFNKSSLYFFGFVFSKDGIPPDPRKVEAIHNMDRPSSVHEVQSFLGMATYCAKFIPSFSDISHPLRELPKKDANFEWNSQHQSLLEEIKKMLTSEVIMSYFDPQKETDLTTDASPVGLSAILSQRTPGQNDRKVIYTSRALSDVERRYSQTEKEALAIVWAIERLHIYLYGKQFNLFTDCKPVQLIFSNPMSRPPARIERWNLRLQGYNFQVVHTKGSQIPLIFSQDTLVSLSLRERRRWQKNCQFPFISCSASSHDTGCVAELQEATKADKTLQHLIQMIRTGDWSKISLLDDVDKTQLKQLAKVKEDLTIADKADLILCGNQRVTEESSGDRT